MAYPQPTIGDLLIATLWSAASTKIYRDILRERTMKRYKEQSVRNSLSRLRAKGYVVYSPTGWSLSSKGKKKFKAERLLEYLPSPFHKNEVRDTIVSFDIPETDRKVRNWLRNQIKIFGYNMLQQSLWIGPGPLPEKFLERLKKLGIRNYVKILRIKKR